GRLTSAIRTAVTELPDFDAVLLQMVKDELRQQQGSRGRQEQELARQLAAAERNLQNILAAVREAGPSPSLLEELTRLEKEKSRLAWEQQQLTRAATAPPELPTVAGVKGKVEQAFDTLAVRSPEFGRLLRGLIPRIVVYPYRLRDGGHPVLRGHFTLCLAPLLPPAPGLERLAGALERHLIVDLFEPPQREAFRVPVMELTANGLRQSEIAW